MDFEVIGEITEVEVIAKGRALKARRQLTARYGRGSWRKLKGIANVRLSTGHLRQAELHWYEAHGLGRRNIKIRDI